MGSAGSGRVAGWSQICMIVCPIATGLRRRRHQGQQAVPLVVAGQSARPLPRSARGRMANATDPDMPGICPLAVDESLLSDPVTTQGSSSRARHIALAND